jgi:hypothetical protein
MPRPEIPITWDGPVADLGRALREIRDKAGRPPYRKLAADSHYSPTVLADAASGRSCPTWEVTEAYARACGAAPAQLHTAWARASTAARRKTSTARRARTRTRARQASRIPVVAGHRVLAPGEPDPSTARTVTEYVQMLRALRAWAGDLGHKEISFRAGRRLARSTMYDALRPDRTTLPALDTVRDIVRACAPPGAYDDWTNAWRIVRLAEFYSDSSLQNSA